MSVSKNIYLQKLVYTNARRAYGVTHDNENIAIYMFVLKLFTKTSIIIFSYSSDQDSVYNV